MRILLIAPDLPDINSTPEIRTLSGLHTVQVLNGRLSKEDVSHEARRYPRDIVHVAAHSDDRGVLLSDGVRLEPDELANIVRLSRAKTVFFNSCFSSRLANYVVSHGASYGIYYASSLIDSPNPSHSEAWQFPLVFYEELARARDRDGREHVDISNVFWSVDQGDGYYGLAISQASLREKNDIVSRVKELHEQMKALKEAGESRAREAKYMRYYVTFLTFWSVGSTFLLALMR